MEVFSRITTILTFILLCSALVIRGVEFVRSEEQPAKQNKFHLTQRIVNSVVRLSLYSIAACMISWGVDLLTWQFEKNLILRWLLDFIIILLIWFSPYEIRRIKRTNISSWPISICWIVSVLYGSVGFSLMGSHGLGPNYQILVGIFWSASVTTLKLMSFLHVMLTQVNPWYQSLPRS